MYPDVCRFFDTRYVPIVLIWMIGTADGPVATEQEHETSREWLRLHAAQLALRGELEDVSSEEGRKALLEQFARNRDAIAAIEESQSKQPQTPPGEGNSEVTTMASGGQPGNEHAENTGVDVDDLFDSLGLNDDDRERVAAPTAVAAGTTRNGADKRLWAALAGVLGIVAIVAIGVAIWFAGSDDSTETAAQGGLEVSTTNAGPSLEDQANEVRSTLDRLGFGQVEVDVRDSVIHVSGVVPSEQDLSTLRSTVLGSVDANALDMSDIEVMAGGYDAAAPQPGQPAPGQPPPGRPAPGDPAAGAPPAGGPPGRPPPGSPPPGFVPPTPEQQENLQNELNRVLTETPLVFEPGSTSLNELQLRVLDTTIITLLEAHPGVPVRLVGYTDETGGEFENSILSFDRAEAVRDYLLSRGVPEHILRVEGRGEDDASGEAGADRRVEIEVISDPFGS